MEVQIFHWILLKKGKNLNEIFYLGQNKDLTYVRVKNNNLHIGAATPINDILGSLKKYYPEFYEMFERYGSEQIRNVASLGRQYWKRLTYWG